jgi:hypothetical protein
MENDFPAGVNGNTRDLLWKLSEYFTFILTHCICSAVYPYSYSDNIYVILVRMNYDYNYLIKNSSDIS